MSLKKILIVQSFLLVSLCTQSIYAFQDQDHMHQNVSDQEKDSVTVAAGALYQTSGAGKFFFGKHYRKAWTTPIKVPVLDLDKAKTGVEILGQGGGMQTYSLKLKGDDGKLYSLRSIQKDPTPVMPKPVRETFLADIVQDQISAAHPYGAFIIPSLAKAADLYCTNPVLYYMPDTEELNEYKEKFGGMMMMLEEDVDEDWSDEQSFGYTENAVSTSTVLENLREENETYVDQKFVVRARLFDMWIGDWDRHEGQWRWAEFEDDNENKFYQPVPEDRDNAFFKFDGFFPWWVQRKWAVRSLQKFDHKVKDIIGLNYNARYFDRLFLTELSRDEWLEQAHILQEKLTDKVIEEAIAKWPEKIASIDGQNIKDKLVSRRSLLAVMASEYYAVLAKRVNVYGSEEQEFFDVTRISDDKTEVKVYDVSDGEKDELLYKRTFNTKETREIRLYGFDDDDIFKVKGDVKDGIVVRIIGGEGKDKVIDESSVSGLRKHTILYDLPDTDTSLSSETKNMTSPSLDVNRFNIRTFEYDRVAPLISFGFNSDDGLFIGGGVAIRKEGFRKRPFASQHKILANVSTQSGAWNFSYKGELIDRFENGDLVLNATIKAPQYSSNFYGFGNNTSETQDDDFYNYRRNELKLFPAIRFKTKVSNIEIGPVFEYYKIQIGDGILAQAGSQLDQVDFDPQHYLGFRFKSGIGKVDSDTYPETGIMWNSAISSYEALSTANRAFSAMSSDLSMYYTFFQTHTTFASRIGGAHNIGDFPFFSASTLGGNQGIGMVGNLRGMRRERFSGQSAAYHNLEVRQKLGIIRTYAASFLYGVNLFFDYGRVWTPGDDSDIWHNAYGGGVWTRVYFNWLVSASYARSDVDAMFNVQLSFLF